MYDKFSCYKSGEVVRKSKILRDLTDTYFTVEKLNNKINKQKERIENATEESIEDFYNDFKMEFNDIVEKITKIFDDLKYQIDYQMENNIMYCQITIDNILSGDDIERIEMLKEVKFHVIVKFDDEKTIIEIHKKGY